MVTQRRIHIILTIFSLGLALLIMIIPITEINNIQIIALQNLYWVLDKSGLLFRSLVFLIFSFAGMIVLPRITPSLKLDGTFRYFIGIALLGLVTGLAIFYGFSCCDTPVSFFMGFPFSWLRGITPAQHYLPLPAFQYLVTNILQIDWGIDIVSLSADILFWYIISLLVFALKYRRVGR